MDGIDPAVSCLPISDTTRDVDDHLQPERFFWESEQLCTRPPGLFPKAMSLFRTFAANRAIPDGLSLALIGNASEQTLGVAGIWMRGVFDKETRRKPLAFAADAVRYGI